MKVKFYYLALATAFTTLGLSSLCLAEPPKNIKVGPIDLKKIDPNALKNPTIPQGGFSLTPSISGKLKFLAGQYGSVPDCKDAQLYLISDEYTEKPAPPPKPGAINLGSSGTIRIPIFVYKGKVSTDPSKGKSDNKTTHCKYSVLVEKKFADKKAYVQFEPDNLICGNTPVGDSGTSVVVPALSVKKDFQVTICGIG
jgi:hypothetical protein